MAVKADQVRALANLPKESILPTSTVQLFCDSADLIVSEDLQGKGLSSDRLELIGMYLAAHFAVISQEYGGLSRQIVGQSQEMYHNDLGSRDGLATTRFGRQAVALDSSGTLGALSAKPLSALFTLVGCGEGSSRYPKWY